MGDLWIPFEWRVRYHETDQMKIVYHTNYLTWFEIGRTEWIRAHHITYSELEKRGILLPLVEAELKFKQPARYDDLITIYTRLHEHSPLRLVFTSEIRRHDPLLSSRNREDGELLVSGMTRHVWVNDQWKPIRIDKAAPDVYPIIAGLPDLRNSES